MTDDGTRNSVLMLALAGMKPRDIAEALGISELLVRKFLRQGTDDKPTPPRAA